MMAQVQPKEGHDRVLRGPATSVSEASEDKVPICPGNKRNPNFVLLIQVIAQSAQMNIVSV